ncbi:UvrD/REP helicase [Amycolatopsis mediterranei S699]|uniref:UvrD/REP helicase n=2 Tax=Amycolatopsis mediterranei TaxID=33910 RepID=A0A0H3D9Z5_AMYMU|nr:UvrD-helicase domain-containing protein [Amycolatopsis mediterranei]ADJ47825.1 UvrD/REP helicase [Amycolatopsis mediterranei U32]AEK44714.1 UvrD/REP helicase [Amycolatopsis mediterranei S699]AFO79536.1 UvrD/REP helicase [Amycolatopsis mediterranei S699]AGT86664.1 UvrD/REP helicase [Amycolatopsis mediterranei RB]KDO10370.1 helicase UvrD [Amycolatopsis mediterranei]
MGLGQHAKRVLQQQASALLTKHIPQLDADRRRILTALLVETAGHWRLFVRADPPDARADAFLIGPEGLFAVTIAARPPQPPGLHALVRHAEESCAGIRDGRGRELTGSAVHFVLITPGPRNAVRDAGPFRVLAETELAKLFKRTAPHLDRRQVEAIGEQARRILGGYVPLRVQAPGPSEPAAGFLDPGSLVEAEVAAAQLRPFDSWLTFLHPHQRAIVTRDYRGPARISGPAGTGKTVVALHRLRHVARRTAGPVLFTTFVRTLPPVHEAAFRRLAPEFGDRAEFVHLHAWVRRFLTARERPVDVDARGVRTAFGRAWSRHRAVLEPIERHDEYWRTEIDRVIKGRGFTTLEQYRRPAVRRGRELRLGPEQKAAVWQFYETYQEMLAERGLHDYNDVIDIALAELRRQPLETRYAAVVVDEVQDITLNGLRLIKELAGTGPNQLLLVGDGQQQVYPGGWRLSDAGIPVLGRGEVLRVNYRNRTEVLAFAQRFDARNEVDDLDGASGVALKNAEAGNTGGTAVSWRGTEADLAAELTRRIAGLTAPLGQTALILFQRQDLVRCRRILREAGIPVLSLDDYSGAPDDHLKVGTVHRAKGLDFQAVLVVEFPARPGESGAAAEEASELRDRQRLVAATRARDFLWWGVVEENGDTFGAAG